MDDEYTNYLTSEDMGTVENGTNGVGESSPVLSRCPVPWKFMGVRGRIERFPLWWNFMIGEEGKVSANNSF